MRPALFLLPLAGCPWIGFGEHADNQAALNDADADADTDADSDTDADTDADTDPTAETGDACVDDAQEPNDFAAQAFEAQPPGPIVGTLCPDDLGAGGAEIPTDAYAIQVPADRILVVDVQPGATTSCEDQDFAIDLSFDGVLREVGSGPCPTLHGVWGPGRYVVELRDPGRTRQDYALALSTETCRDRDGDDQLAATCGGPDCDDEEPSVKVGGVEVFGDRIDQDCDGGDDLVGDACTTTAVGASQANGTLRCGDPATEAVWDAWILPAVGAGELLNLAVRNGAGGADLLALLVQSDGGRYGFEADRSQFDDELDCAPSWTGDNSSCPGACVETTANGPMTLWVAQHPGPGCQDGARYDLLVRVMSTGDTPVLDTQPVNDGPLEP